MRFRSWLLFAACLAVAGCGLSREKLTAPVPGAPQFTGTVVRAGAAVAAMPVKLYNDVTGAQADSTSTDASGTFGFSNVPAGRWMIKVSPTGAGDLGYVRYFVDLASDGAPAVIPPFDVSAHGFDLLMPADGADMAHPSAGSPITMGWSPYAATYVYTSARVSDSTGASVWASPAAQATHAEWDGTGNDGSYSGQIAPAGRYTWRVRIRLSNGVQGASRQRALAIGAQ